MTDAEKKMKRYVNAVERRLNLPRDIKVRVMSDFASSITARREAGETDADIYAALGSPKQVAAELNAQMKDFAYRKSPWRFGCLALAAAAALWLAFYAGISLFVWIYLNLMGNTTLGIIGGADGPTAVFVTATVGFDWDLLIAGAALLLGILGYLKLCKCRK